jgi:hypothetical protein
MTIKYTAGTVVTFGWRGKGGFLYNCGVVLPYHNRENNLFILSDYDCEVHKMRLTSRGTWILATEKRDDGTYSSGKHRLDMRALTEAEQQQLGKIGSGPGEDTEFGVEHWALYHAVVDPNNTAAEWEAYQLSGGTKHGDCGERDIICYATTEDAKKVIRIREAVFA